MSLFLILNMITQINLDDAKMSSMMQNGTIKHPVLQFSKENANPLIRVTVIQPNNIQPLLLHIES